ncbi:hypothetical protein DM01DRAFT_1334670 [Hesseltinella vesiculosa]|uniref:U6 small nuclear RNA (adenine-(43)-N(6))-methyltransferase n=1 Tax=Hesseltinella vesiculosa TaxID=101127 RepID=A0A1X2GKF3_9FUNG|nr:hypothetical protein DM01DRAFT_1334670 [Hesseltinella vesiculosa]
MAVKELTICLLKRDFDLNVQLPLTRLIPPIPNRLNYILWIEDLLMETMPDVDSRPVHGIDIGVGASCIYPLLGCRSNPNWHFLGTEIDEESLHCAQANVMANQLDNRITLVLNNDSFRIFVLPVNTTYDFCMCNPPFYASMKELEEGLRNKELEPSAVCTGSNSELITDGGEFAFIKRMILESVRYRDRIHWYTSMMGLKRTIRPITQVLKEHKINNYVVTEFCQGRTKRWGIAWSFQSARVNRAISLEAYRPKSQFEVTVPISLIKAEGLLLEILRDLSIPVSSGQFSIKEQEHKLPGKGISFEIQPQKNTWSRSARRSLKRQRIEQQSDMTTEAILAALPPISLSIELSLVNQTDQESTLRASWMHGPDRSVFESFWSHLKKRIEQGSGISQGSRFVNE